MSRTARRDTAVVGVDLGTQGARAIAVAPDGEVLALAAEALPPSFEGIAEGRHEQDPAAWWRATATCLSRLVRSLDERVRLAGIAVTSTSGTIVAADAVGRPLHPAILYNDVRGVAVLTEVRDAGQSLAAKLGYRFDSSFALPKLVWIARERPDLFERTQHFLHAADFLVARLSGEIGVTDWTNALKTGFDVVAGRWPASVAKRLGLPLEKLPRVVAPGTRIGAVIAAAAAETGIPAGVPVFAGATDGVAALLASGAASPGDWNSTLGTTLVVKGITRERFGDPERGVYCHRHPEGWWLPGGASNVGSEWIALEHRGAYPAILDAEAELRLPTRIVRYPLARRGERFPFASAEARGFTRPAPRDEAEAYAAGLEGVALVERLAYDTLARLSAPIGGVIHATGGGARSDTWLKVRASMLGRALRRAQAGEAALGAAILAGSSIWFGSVTDAARALVRSDVTVEPDRALSVAYEEKYGRFLDELRRRGFLRAPAKLAAESVA